MNHEQEREALMEEAARAAEASRRLKKRMIVVIVCLLVFAAVGFPLISLLDRMILASEGDKNDQNHNHTPPSSIIFATPDYEYDIMKDRDYLNLDRAVYFTNEDTGETIMLSEKDLQKYGDALPILVEMIDCIIQGDADRYNTLFSENYFANNEPEPPFTMQQLYDIHLTRVNVSEVIDERGKYTMHEYVVEYRIRWNNGTFRTDIGHDESKKQYFILSDSTGKGTLIDQIQQFNYRY